jgi:hypothetical protein
VESERCKAERPVFRLLAGRGELSPAVTLARGCRSGGTQEVVRLVLRGGDRDEGTRERIVVTGDDDISG